MNILLILILIFISAIYIQILKNCVTDTDGRTDRHTYKLRCFASKNKSMQVGVVLSELNVTGDSAAVQTSRCSAPRSVCLLGTSCFPAI